MKLRLTAGPKASTSLRMIRFLAAVALALTLGTSGLQGEETPLRVVFWNVEWFPGGSPQATPFDSVRQIMELVPAMAGLSADIVGFTEILNEGAMEVALLKTPGVTPQVCSAFLDDDGLVTRQQIGIASRLPAMNAWWENWKTARVTPKRGFTFAAFEPLPGQVLLIYTVHLKSNRGDQVENFAMREESARQLLLHVTTMEKAYAGRGKVGIIIGGDFNTSLDDPRFDQEKTLRALQKAGFVWGWEGMPFADRVTLPTKPSNNPNLPPFPDTCFDHAFVKNLKVVSAKVGVFDPAPSDHRPVILEITFP